MSGTSNEPPQHGHRDRIDRLGHSHRIHVRSADRGICRPDFDAKTMIKKILFEALAFTALGLLLMGALGIADYIEVLPL